VTFIKVELIPEFDMHDGAGRRPALQLTLPANFRMVAMLPEGRDLLAPWHYQGQVLVRLTADPERRLHGYAVTIFVPTPTELEVRGSPYVAALQELLGKYPYGDIYHPCGAFNERTEGEMIITIPELREIINRIDDQISRPPPTATVVRLVRPVTSDSTSNTHD
jgi:hypothetical protein